MYTVINYGIAFFQVVIVNCIQPVNWKYCYPTDQWLFQDLQYAWELKTGKVHPYQTEKEYLESFK